MPEITARECAHCGEVFTPKAHAYARCCSGKCSRLLWYYRHRRVVAHTPRDCPVCRKPLDDGSHPNKIYCEVSCREVARRLTEHGLTLAQYRRMLEAQGNRCAICRVDESGLWHAREVKRDGWHIDHDHATGVVRGILCPPCNLMIGYAQDDPNRLVSAATYLATGTPFHPDLVTPSTSRP